MNKAPVEECSSLKSTDTIKISKGIFTIFNKKMPRENPTLSDDAE